jgi:hypothetical protein
MIISVFEEKDKYLDKYIEEVKIIIIFILINKNLCL